MNSRLFMYNIKQMGRKRKLSFVIPARNEEASVEILYKEIVEAVKRTNFDYEIMFIDDGSTDSTFDKFTKLSKTDKNVKVIKLRGNWGKAVALQTGFDLAKGDIIFTLDADLQDNPKEIPRFIKKLDEGYDLVVGWKKDRHDPVHTVIMSRILNNFLIPQLTKVNIHDTNCGFKVYKAEVAKELNLYGELYRFIPILISKQNYKIAELEIQHRARIHGKSKYGIGKNAKGLLDLLTVFFLTGYLRRPGHFFGGLGMLSFGAGFLIGLYIAYLRITTGSIQFRHPLLFFGMLLMIIGVQLVTTGLIAEMIVNLNQRKDHSGKIQKTLK